MNLRKWMQMLLTVSVAATIAFTPVLAQQTVSRMTIETLAGMLDEPELVIVDARSGHDWNASEFKIKGAVRPDMTRLNDWKDQFGLDQTLVIYCA